MRLADLKPNTVYKVRTTIGVTHNLPAGLTHHMTGDTVESVHEGATEYVRLHRLHHLKGRMWVPEQLCADPEIYRDRRAFPWNANAIMGEIGPLEDYIASRRAEAHRVHSSRL